MAEDFQESAIDDYIDAYREQDVTFDKLHFKELMTSTKTDSTPTIIISDSILDNYKKELNDILITKTYTQEEKPKYLYNPWALSYALYGTTAYWWLLLEANNLYSAIEFNKTTVNVYSDLLPSVIDAILNAEEDAIDKNNRDINSDLNEFDDVENYDESGDDTDIEEDEDD